MQEVQMAVSAGNREAARAVSRCYGALFFTFFGSAWMLLAAYAAKRLHLPAAIAIAALAAGLVTLALLLQRRGQQAAKHAYPQEEVRRNGRAFGILNAVQGIAIFLAFWLFPGAGEPDLAFPAVVLIVGLHFFAMPPLYRYRTNTVTGVCLTVLAVLCMLLLHGDRMVAVVALGAGTILWLSAAWALWTAWNLLLAEGL